MSSCHRSPTKGILCTKAHWKDIFQKVPRKSHIAIEQLWMDFFPHNTFQGPQEGSLSKKPRGTSFYKSYLKIVLLSNGPSKGLFTIQKVFKEFLATYVLLRTFYFRTPSTNSPYKEDLSFRITLRKVFQKTTRWWSSISRTSSKGHLVIELFYT